MTSPNLTLFLGFDGVLHPLIEINEATADVMTLATNEHAGVFAGMDFFQT